MGTALDINAALALLASNRTALVPSIRAAENLRHQYDKHQRTQGSGAWAPPSVLSWDEWTEALWRRLTLDGADDRILLNRVQEEALWAELIHASKEGASLEPGAVTELARLARSGLQLAAAHNAIARIRTDANSPDARAFGGWHRAFIRRSEEDRLIPRALLEQALQTHLKSKHVVLPQELHLLGFELLTPAQTLLLDAISAASCPIETHSLVSPARSAAKRQMMVAPDPETELQLAMQWIRERSEESQEIAAPLALIVPDPAAEFPQLEPLLRQFLAPELESVSADLSSMPWHFSTGPSLASLPIIQHALLLLRWTQESLPIASVRTLLFSPFFEHRDELEARAYFDSHILGRALLLRPEIDLDMLLRLRAYGGVAGPRPALSLAPWRAVANSVPPEPGKTNSHAGWTEHARKLLSAAGWPGPRTLSAAEFHATEAWESLLDLLATLDLHGRRIPFSTLLQLLAREAQVSPAPDSNRFAPLQILRLSESAGCVYDAALILRATDESLPPKEHLHPLLGWALQHDLGLPGTSPARSHARTRDALHNLMQRSGDVLLSAPGHDNRGSLRLTPLAEELGFLAVAPDSMPKGTWEDDATLLPVTLPDTDPLPPLPSSEVSHGARVLELQAACGFRAWASLRLDASAPEGKTLGLDAREAGKALHEAMALFWAEVRTQAALREISLAERANIAHKCVAKALERVLARAVPLDAWSEAYLDIFQQRLVSLIQDWLDWELKRAPFEVLTPEQQQFITIGPLHLKVRPDRIDEVAGGLVFIDYKTSAGLSTKDWLGRRPKLPQLPLYVLLRKAEDVRGLAFASMRRGKDMGWLSLEDEPGVIRRDGNRKSLHDIAGQIALWRAELDSLASDFAAGRADVRPKQYPKTCQYCEHRLLCRLDPATMLAMEEDDALQPEGGEAVG